MTPDELRAYITERIAADADIRRVLAAITAQTADLSDSQAYALRSGEISGKALAAALLDLDASERSASVFGILWDRYRDENRVFDEIQAILDKQLGIQLAPQHADFPEERAKAMANALCDESASDETLRRRAESAANIIAAMHDGNIRANAEFRSRAGLQSSAIREGGAKCCDWCASVSGRYQAHDTPDGFWGRHDNCKCSILYETKRGWRTHTGTGKAWQSRPAEDAGAPPLTRLTAEQAAEREAQHPVISFSPEQARELEENALMGLTIGANRSIISAITIDDFKAADKGGEIDSACFDTILGAIKTARGRGFFIFDSVAVVDIPDKPNGGTDVMRTNVYNQAGNPFVVLELNHAVFAGATKNEIDSAFRGAANTTCNSLEEATWHECGHARTAFGRTYASYERINETLNGEYFTGPLPARDDKKSLRDLAGSVSELAQKDGLECIAECEVILERGEDLDPALKAFYDLFTSGGG